MSKHYMKAKKRAQEIIDEYLHETGQNVFEVRAFVLYLEDKPDHEAYTWIYGEGKDDASMALEARIARVRQKVSGLRFTIRYSEPVGRRVVAITREYPSMTSPLSSRGSGGGYVGFDPSDPIAMSDLRDQGKRALRGWLGRYAGAFDEAGIDLSAIYDLAEIAREDAA